jgi:hypothetical protein
MDRPNIEAVRQFGGKHAEWAKYDLFEKLGSLMNVYKLDAATGQFNTSGLAMGWQTPWVHQLTAADKRCNIDSQIKFEKFGFIAPRCLQCWKVVVKPRTLKELFMLEQLQKTMGVASKCGIELRNYTPRHYGGYFYTSSIEEGQARYKEVREAVNDQISPDVDVLLKRGCTEFEMVKGNAGFWSITPEELEMDEIIENRFTNNTALGSRQPDHVVAHVKKEWMKFAYANGDMTYKEFNGGVDMFPQYQHFHDVDLQAVKNEMAMAQALGNGIDPETTRDFRILTGNFLGERGMTGHAAGQMLGMFDKNYFEPMAIGEQDELT